MSLQTLVKRRLLEDKQVKLRNDISLLNNDWRATFHNDNKRFCRKCTILRVLHKKEIRLMKVNSLIKE